MLGRAPLPAARTICTMARGLSREAGDPAPDIDERSTDRLEMTARCVVFPTQQRRNCHRRFIARSGLDDRK
jgi:hypothetical protein